jgi:hypothetical protein
MALQILPFSSYLILLSVLQVLMRLICGKIDNPNIFAILSEENNLKQCHQMKEFGIQIKILSFHWGNEYVNIPSFDSIYS